MSARTVWRRHASSSFHTACHVYHLHEATRFQLSVYLSFSCNPPATIFALVMGICVQCGTTSNPCRCKVVGPTLGFLAFVAAAMVEWPLGAVVYCFRHVKGRHIMAHPAMVVYPSVSNSIPI
ncbi:hypothetical protein SAY87_024590 [Trapa incisa]|uniref:Uncharacterized protein n=1 Tax=Trapa incisa TaxID=236973 RepID=A0AAN7GL31_9MYRT|nr:hypothetical protein SAY87_024590 [Trapa incisa]